MEVDEVEEQVSKFQKGSCNGGSSMIISDSSSNPNKLATQKGNYLYPVGDGVGDGGGGDCVGVGGGSLSRWPSSRIVRVSRASGGKDRHSKVVTSKGLRDRRIRLSVSTAIEFYDLQDRLGFDQPSKAVDWLIKAASSSIDELPSLDPSFFSADGQRQNMDRQHIRQRHTQLSITDFEDQNHQTNNHYKEWNNNDNSNSNNNSSSASETSKGSGLSLSRSENRIRARERARDMTTKKEKKKDTSSFTDLLTDRINNNVNPGGRESRIHWTTPIDYFQMPQFEDNNNNQPHQNQFSVLEDNFVNRGTLQSNLLSSLPHHQQLQRFQPSLMVDGSTSTNFPFFIAPDHFPTTEYDSKRLQHYGGVGGGPDHIGRKSKN